MKVMGTCPVKGTVCVGLQQRCMVHVGRFKAYGRATATPGANLGDCEAGACALPPLLSLHECGAQRAELTFGRGCAWLGGREHHCRQGFRGTHHRQQALQRQEGDDHLAGFTHAAATGHVVVSMRCVAASSKKTSCTKRCCMAVQEVPAPRRRTSQPLCKFEPSSSVSCAGQRAPCRQRLARPDGCGVSRGKGRPAARCRWS
jgi:hypothetical protein